jgi:hypothetical protein
LNTRMMKDGGEEMSCSHSFVVDWEVKKTRAGVRSVALKYIYNKSYVVFETFTFVPCL